MRFSAVSPYNAAAKLRLPEKVVVYDSTLRDGEQMPGVHFTLEQKTSIARKLDEVGVHQIEAGFPAVSESEKAAVKEVASLGLDAEVLCLSRALKQDIDAAVDCDVDMVLLFIATSDLHLRYKLKMTREQVLEKAVEAVDYASAHGLKASMSSEDSTRSDVSFMADMFGRCEHAGAARLGITDTLGCGGPEAVQYIVSSLREKTKLPLSAHLHNDFGLATVNAVAALSAGAEAIATTVGGIGERAGNVSLEQFVMALKHLYKKDIGIKTDGLTDLARTVFEAARLPMPANQPWVGPNAFSHESGIHVAAVLSCPMTYECVNPEEVGNRRRLVLGKHSGTHIVKSRLDEKGVSASQEQICDIVRAIKRAGEEHGRVSDDEFWSIVNDVVGRPAPNPDCVEKKG
ncbi:MAG: methanogen homocitrate synthase [Candidatus Thermoplasmatota archaeon]|nr:methanogen homocitrate synthase [Candidatus Thermoplasmatota archaeon]